MGTLTGFADQKEVDFIRKWIFPGGFLPTISFIMESIRIGAESLLVVDSVANIGVRLSIFSDRPSPF